MRRSRHRRSRASDAAVSLFSFQDIMTAVMGILILITLLMALDLTVTISQPAQAAAKPGMASATDLAALRARQTHLEQQYREALARATQLGEMQGADDTVVQQARGRLVLAYQHLEALQEKVERARAILADAPNPKEVQAQLDELDRAEAEIERLSALIDQRRRHPRLSYIHQRGATRTPILIDVSNRAFGVGMIDDPESALWLTNPDKALRLRQLQELARNRNSHREYFVLLLRPSAFDQYDAVNQVLRSAGFAVGLELIEEATIVLPRPEE